MHASHQPHRYFSLRLPYGPKTHRRDGKMLSRNNEKRAVYEYCTAKADSVGR